MAILLDGCRARVWAAEMIWGSGRGVRERVRGVGGGGTEKGGEGKVNRRRGWKGEIGGVYWS